jgi:hypothetical protein
MMRFETDGQKRTIQRWCRFAIQLNGAIDSGHFGHLTVQTVAHELVSGDVFAVLRRELPPSVWEVSQLTDVDRHVLAKQWRLAAEGFDPEQFHVSRNGLAFLIAVTLSMIDNQHALIPS